MPFLCEEHGACVLEVTEKIKRPRVFTGAEAANLGGSGFPPAGAFGGSRAGGRKTTLDQKKRSKITPTFTSEHCRTRENATLVLQAEARAMFIRQSRAEISLEVQLLEHAREAREAAHLLPPGKKREMLLRQARASEMAARVDRWISSPGLRPPE
jgi:hypothetical protein